MYITIIYCADFEQASSTTLPEDQAIPRVASEIEVDKVHLLAPHPLHTLFTSYSVCLQTIGE